MISIGTRWEVLKQLGLPIKYAVSGGNYYIYCQTESTEYTCTLDQGSVDGIDFEENYKNAATSLV